MSKKSFDARAAVGSSRSWLALGFALVALVVAGCGSSRLVDDVVVDARRNEISPR